MMNLFRKGLLAVASILWVLSLLFSGLDIIAIWSIYLLLGSGILFAVNSYFSDANFFRRNNVHLYLLITILGVSFLTAILGNSAIRALFGNFNFIDSYFAWIFAGVISFIGMTYLKSKAKLDILRISFGITTIISFFGLLAVVFNFALPEVVMWLVIPVTFLMSYFVLANYRIFFNSWIDEVLLALNWFIVIAYLWKVNDLLLSIFVLVFSGLIIRHYAKSWGAIKSSIQFLFKSVIFLVILVILSGILQLFVQMEFSAFENVFVNELSPRTEISRNIYFDSLSAKTLLFGHGGGSYLEVFAQNIDENFAKTDAWRLLFSRPGTMFGVLVLEFGLIFLVSIFGLIVYLLNKLLKINRFRSNILAEVGLLGIFTLIGLTFFLPASGVFWLWLFFFWNLNYEVFVIEKKKGLVEKLIILGVSLLLLILVIVHFSPLVKMRSLVNEYRKEQSLEIVQEALPLVNRAFFSDYIARELSKMTINEVLKGNSHSGDQITILVQASLAGGERAVEMNDKNFINWMNLGSIYRSLIGSMVGAELRATYAFKKAQELAPYRPDFYLEEAKIYLAMFDLAKNERLDGVDDDILDKALDLIEKAKSLRGEYIEAVRVEALIYERMGDNEKAMSVLTELQRLQTQNPVIAYDLGLLNLFEGNYEDAIANFRYATDLYPIYSNAFWFMSVAYEQLGENEMAKEALSKILIYDEDNQRVRQRLERLQRNSRIVEEIPEPLEEEFEENGEEIELDLELD